MRVIFLEVAVGELHAIDFKLESNSDLYDSLLYMLDMIRNRRINV